MGVDSYNDSVPVRVRTLPAPRPGGGHGTRVHVSDLGSGHTHGPGQRTPGTTWPRYFSPQSLLPRPSGPRSPSPLPLSSLPRRRPAESAALLPPPPPLPRSLRRGELRPAPEAQAMFSARRRRWPCRAKGGRAASDTAASGTSGWKTRSSCAARSKRRSRRRRRGSDSAFGSDAAQALGRSPTTRPTGGTRGATPDRRRSA